MKTDSPKGIVMVIARFAPAIGGTENQCRQLSRTLAAKGHPVAVVTERFQSSLPETETIDGFEVRRLHVRGPSVLALISFGFQFWTWLKRHPDFSVVHAHMLAGPTLAAVLVGKLLGKTVLVKAAGAGPTGDIGTSVVQSRGRLKLWLFKALKIHVVCPSPLTFGEIINAGFAKTRVHLIPNGVDTATFQPASSDLKASARKQLGWPTMAPIALYVGRWARGKGVEDLLTIWEKGLKDGLNWQLSLVIDRELTPEESRRLEPLKPHVFLAHRVKDPRPFYQAADMALLLSANEGLSNFLLEAIASGLPVASTAAAALRPAEETRNFGWTLEANELLALLKSLQADNAPLKTKGEKARVTAESLFSIAATATQYEELYDEVAA